MNSVKANDLRPYFLANRSIFQKSPIVRSNFSRNWQKLYLTQISPLRIIVEYPFTAKFLLRISVKNVTLLSVTRNESPTNMSHRCPKCHAKIEQLFNGCPHCNWSLSETIISAQEPVTPSSDEDEGSNSSTSMHIDMAMASIEREDYSAALESLNHAIVDANMTDLAECYSLRGFVHLRLEKFGLAEDDCSESIHQRGNDPETLSWRAAARGELGRWREAFADLIAARRMAHDPEPYDKLLASYSEPALESYRQQVKDGNSSADLFCDRGQVYLTIGNEEKARRDFNLALEQDSNADRALIGLASLELRDGKYVEAEKLASKALLSTRDHTAEALGIRAQSLAALGETTRALRDVDLLREKCGDTAAGLVECAKLREQFDDLAGAIEDLGLAIELNHFHAAAIHMRGDIYNRLHNYDLAVEDYSNYLELVPNDHQVLLERGRANLARKKLESAKADFDALIDKDEINTEAYLGRSQVFLEKDDLEAAEADCQKAVRLDSRNPDALTTRGKILSSLSKDYFEAEECFTKAIELHSEEDNVRVAENYYLRGISRYEQQKFFKAAEDFRRAISLRSRHPGSYVWNAIVSAKLENWADAIDNLQQAISLRPSAANQYRRLGKPAAEKAIEYYDQLIKRGNSDSQSFRNRGMAYQFLGSIDLAIQDFSMSLREDPNDVDSRVRHAQLLLQRNRLDDAIRDLAKVIKDDKSNHHARYVRALARVHQGELDLAVRDIEKAIELDDDCAQYWVLRGDLLAKQNQMSGAIGSYNAAVKIDPTDYVAMNQRGNSWIKIGQPLRAISDFTESLRIYPRQPSIVSQRGTAHQRNGQYDMANADFELALTHDEHLIKAYCGRAACLAHMDQPEEALIWLTKQIHRFPEGRGLAEILMSRGKVYYQMGRFAPAAADFTMVITLERNHPQAVAMARCARAVAFVQNGQLIRAEKEFEKVLEEFPKHEGAATALEWMRKGVGPRPTILAPPEQLIRPTRPPISRKSINLTNGRKKEAEKPPFDLWILRTKEKREYGPVSRQMLDSWISEGRVSPNAKLLRSGWPKWRQAVVVYPELVGKQRKPAVK